MSTIATPTAAEPEEIVEVALCSALSAVCTLPVQGAMTPATPGKVKHLEGDSCVTVTVDLSSQDMDTPAPAMFLTLSATIGVHYALCDDADGSSYRDECRRVRATLLALTGDGCSALSSAGVLDVDSFILGSTSTTFEAGDAPTNTKTYTATLNVRAATPTPTQTEEETSNVN